MNSKKTDWSEQHEDLLISWAEKSSGYAWMHNRSINYYKKRNLYISIPASIFGYFAGAVTLLSNETFENIYTKAFIGMCGIFSGILSNFQQMFTFKELSEQHKISSLRFLSFFRDVSSELSMNPKNRNNPIDYITLKRIELDKMLEQSPSIPQKIIDEFNKKTKHIKSSFHKPEISNILQTIIPYSENKNSFYNNNHSLKKYFLLWKNYSYNIKNEKNKKQNGLIVEVANSTIKDDDSTYIDILDDKHSVKSENNEIRVNFSNTILDKDKIFDNNVKIGKNNIIKNLSNNSLSNKID